MTTLLDRIEQDTKYGNTPDLPDLRYRKDLWVFLWDDMSEISNLTVECPTIDLIKGYRSESRLAATRDNYVPWYNISDGNMGDDYHTAYCLEEAADLEFCDIPEYSHAVPRQLQGKLVRVSLDTLIKLDDYYDNEHTFERQSIQVYRNKRVVDSIVTAFTWFNPINSLFDYDPHDNVYKPIEGVDVSPFVETKDNYFIVREPE